MLKMIHRVYTYDKKPNIDGILQQWIQLKYNRYCYEK